jgi:arsenite-transporting ATPase
MDSICSVLALEKLLHFFSAGRRNSQPEFDVIVYDCNNTEEILRLIGATDRARYMFSLLGHNLNFNQDSEYSL